MRGPEIVAHAPDRLGRNPQEVRNLIHDLREQGIGVKAPADPMQINTAGEGMSRAGVSLWASMTPHAPTDDVLAVNESAGYTRSVIE